MLSMQDLAPRKKEHICHRRPAQEQIHSVQLKPKVFELKVTSMTHDMVQSLSQRLLLADSKKKAETLEQFFLANLSRFH